MEQEATKGLQRQLDSLQVTDPDVGGQEAQKKSWFGAAEVVKDGLVEGLEVVAFFGHGGGRDCHVPVQ